MRSLLQGAGAVALLAVAVFLSVLSWVAGQAPRKIDALQAGVMDQLSFARTELSGQVEAARVDLAARSERQIAAARVQVLELVDRRLGDGLGLVDRRVGDSLTRVDTALGEIREIHADLRPVLTNAAALTADVKDSWDDLYWDVKASVGSATVAARGIAEASEAVGKAAPAIAGSAAETTRQFAGITTDVHAFTTKFVAPRSIKAKLWDGIKTSAFIGARLIP